MRGGDWDAAQFGVFGEGVGYAVLLEFELVVVCYVLPLAAGAGCVVGAGRLDSVGRWFEYLRYDSGNMLPSSPSVADDTRLDALSGDAAEHIYDAVLEAGERIAKFAPCV